MKGRQRNMAIRSGINKQGWQQTDFPVACEKCYGDNPYIRMLKQNYGQQCRICFRPFTVFKWKGNRGIYKRTCVCQSCSKDKNICQVCTLDLQFGLPMEVRDKRCGQNGKYLLDQNFTSKDNKNIKPPKPPGPPPQKNQKNQKQLVFIPEKDSQDEEQMTDQKKQDVSEEKMNQNKQNQQKNNEEKINQNNQNQQKKNQEEINQ